MNGNQQIIRVSVLAHKNTDLLVATSHDLRGLMLAARSAEQIEEELPGAIRRLLEAQGHKVISVSAAHPAELPGDFIDRTIVASAVLEAA